ncbi:MAG: hypothetical protein ACRC1U_10580 [Vibrionaceae bacterium]
MTAPAGGAGGANRPGGANGLEGAGAAGGAPPDPRRPRPDGTPMTAFLMQIGSEHRPEPQDANRRYQLNERDQVRVALELGDIVQVGYTEVNDGQDEPLNGCYPIYQFVGAEGVDDIRFTLDPSCAEPTWGTPPVIEHVPGQVHAGMEHALWASFRYNHPGEEADTEENYYDLQRGIMWRYAGEGKEPKFR